ncbi:MAG: FAD:protein FMN transferase [Clostridiales bacterium]|nr:FAD:protein FMN transferase [Clostridiales bacterium]
MKKAFSIIGAFAASIIMALPLFGCAASGYTVFSETAAFSSDIMFSAKILGGRAKYAYNRMKSVIADIDAQVSLTQKNSDLSRFNAAAAGIPVKVGKYCYEIFNVATVYFEATDGAFNVAAAPLVELWHVDADSIADYRPDIDGAHVSPPLPSKEDVDAAREYCDPTLVTASEEGGSYYLTKADERVKLDFGGIAKGYAIDECVKILGEYDISSALIDISGNAYFYGDYIKNNEHTDWKVGVASPRPRSGETLSRGYVCAVRLGGGVSAVTSGDYNRYYIHDSAGGGKVYVPHIIGTDGAPIGVEYEGGEWVNGGEPVISATVIGKSSANCDALSTAVCALGIEKGASLLRKVGCKGLIFTEKRFTIIGDVALYDTNKYGGYKAYEYFDVLAAAVGCDNEP